MKPIGPLMREHRLIERMTEIIRQTVSALEKGGNPDYEALTTMVDFFRIYADKTHHGKEEDIFFKELGEKELPLDLSNIMKELIEEHKHARIIVTGLLDASSKYRLGDSKSKERIIAALKELATMYPAHIEKEDKHFFYPVLEYLNDAEQQKMLSEFQEFDRKMIHDKYEKVVERLKAG